MAHADDPRERYEGERQRLVEAVERGDVAEDTADRIREVLDALDPEKRRPRFDHGGETVELATNTLNNYGLRLRMVATEIDGAFLELTQDDVDDLMTALLGGDDEQGIEPASIAPDGGYSTGTAGQYESALKAFYRYHDGHSIDPDEIPMETSKPTSVDERDLWTVDEVASLRSVIDSKRNECLFELLCYTGQRLRVIQTLRVRDVDPDYGSTGRYWVNEEAEGRKNREGHGPLLGAQGAVTRWLRVHPTRGEPGHEDDALITSHEPVRYGSDPDDVTRPGDRISETTIRSDILAPIAERAGVEKAINPHMFRHYFSTMALKPKGRGGFGMDPTYVKRLRGDAPGSNVLETTYAHLIDEDASAHAESHYGAANGEEEDGNALVPAGPCDVCGDHLQAGQVKCYNCGTVRGMGDPDELDYEKLAKKLAEYQAGEVG